MIGFFEHQFLSYKKDHLKNLIALARADGHLHESEKELLYKIGYKYGLKDRHIKALLEEEHSWEMKVPDTYGQKMEQLYDLVMMVFADGVVDENEVHFCEQVVGELGLGKAVLSRVISLFGEQNPPSLEEWDKVVEDMRADHLV